VIGRIFTVGGLTLLSRVTGFARDIMLAFFLGAGPVADAFFVALRLPNHFRAIFAEGAFNAAFVPAYARIRQQGGEAQAGLFADRIFTLLLASQVLLLALALVFTPQLVGLLAWGFRDDPGRFALAVEFTRVTFPYLLLMTLVTLYGGILNAVQRFAAAAAAPILLNLAMMAALALAAFFPSAGHAAAWGVLVAGCLEVMLVAADAARNGVLPRFRRPRFDAEVKRFFKVLLPATVASAETQIALFADTIIASFLATGALSALYYADRINQLPVGVIGIAAATVVLPEMARRLAAGDESGARRAQNQAIELTLLLSLPCVVAFLLVPDLIMRALFNRGAFTAADAHAAGSTLAAYAIGLLPFVLIRSVSATFLARGDTVTPMITLFFAIIVNVGLKIALMRDYAQVGLALATSAGAWVNLSLLLALAARQGLLGFDRALASAALKIGFAGAVLAAVLFFAERPLAALAERTSLHDEATLLLLALAGGASYATVVLAMFGRRWFAALSRRPKADGRPPPQDLGA
jgi:putative peptidoglycan lipid II flippase